MADATERAGGPFLIGPAGGSLSAPFAARGDANANPDASEAERLMDWVDSFVVAVARSPDVLLVGDFNAYAKEDPVSVIAAGGYTDLVGAFDGASAGYTYLYDGRIGRLDYAFSSTSLTPHVTGAAAWHINSDESALFDYNDDIRSVGEAPFEQKPDGSALRPCRELYRPGSPYRASDHDPVIVGIYRGR